MKNIIIDNDPRTRKKFESLTQEEKDFILNMLHERLIFFLKKYNHQKKLNKPQLDKIVNYTHDKMLENDIILSKKEVTKHFYLHKNKWVKKYKTENPDTHIYWYVKNGRPRKEKKRQVKEFRKKRYEERLARKAAREKEKVLQQQENNGKTDLK